MNEGEIFTVHINCDAGQDPEIYSLHQNLPPFYYNLFTARKRKEGSPEMRTKYIFLLYPPPAFLRKKVISLCVRENNAAWRIYFYITTIIRLVFYTTA